MKAQKELMKALKEMKIRLPTEKRSKGKSGTLATLQYALSCVKQVQGRRSRPGVCVLNPVSPRKANLFTRWLSRKWAVLADSPSLLS